MTWTPEEYARYLASPHWRATRRRAIQLAGFRCQHCRQFDTPSAPVQLEVHHVTYARIGKERAEDLAVLCEPCHEMEHGLPEHLTTQPGLEPVGRIAERVLHFIARRPPRQNVG